VVARSDDEREVPESDDLEIPADSDSLPLEAEPADVLEQARAEPVDEDEYR